jgi:PAS domain S-box-containing protein
LGREFDRSRELRAAANRSYETRSAIQSVFSLVQDAETGQRGYLITQDPDYLQPYNAAVPRIDKRLEELRGLVGDRPDQLARLDRLERQSDRKLAEMARVLAISDRTGFPAARAAVAEGEGKAAMDELRLAVSEAIGAEAGALRERLAEEKQRSGRAGRAIAALFTLLGAAILCSAMLFIRHVRGRRAMQARLEEVAARQQAVLDSATDAIITLNRSGSIETINLAGQRMFGWPVADLSRRDLSTVLDIQERTEGPFLQRLLGPEGRLEVGGSRELTGRRRDGSTFPVEASLSEMKLPGDSRIVAMIRDVTERQRVTRLKEEFVSTVSHELRTPLTSIAGSLGLVAGGAAGELPEKAKRLVTIALNNSQRLVRLINDILDIEKMESGKTRFELKPVILTEIAARSVDEIRGFADGYGVRVDLRTDGSVPVVRGDGDRLVQVVTNLLSNAIKFTPREGTVSVTISSADGSARLSVRDQGPGIPDSFRGRIFGKFAQADGSDTRQKGGTGLGLAIAREIAERHGGRLWFDTPAEGGAIFHMDLPKVGEHTVGLEPGVRLLVIEDEVVTAAALREVLEDEGFIVDITETLADAEQALRRTEYACLVTDLKLPDGDGLAFVRRVRGGLDNPRVPVIVVSGDAARRREQSRSLALDVAAWMGKPVDPVRLKDAILSALEADGGKPLILHVDDDRDMLQVTAAALASCGEVVSVETLAAAREVLRTRRPDVVVLDLGLEDGPGLDLLPELKSRPDGPVPVVVFTAQEIDPEAAAQVDGVLTKSRISLVNLARTVRRLTRARNAERRRVHETAA